MIANLRSRNTRAELLLLAGGAAALGLAGALLLAPRVRTTARLDREAQAGTARVRQLEQELAPYLPLLADGDRPGPARVFGAASAEAAIPALLDRLAALGRDCALTVTAMSPEASAPQPLPAASGGPGPAAAGEPRRFRVLTVAVEAEADFAGLGRYLEALTGLDVPLAVLALKVEPAAHGGPERVVARFTLGTWVIEAPAGGEGRHDEAA
ncbi:MAG: hypothetical protein ACYDIE_07980 [Candidatus Krumholzibacteriia bacterium]